MPIRRLFIKTEPTPNPNSLIFRPERAILPIDNRTVELTSPAQAARRSPLADELFKIGGVQSVLLAPAFLTVTKQAEVSWPQLNPQIYAAIMDFFTTGQPVLLPDESVAAKEESTDDPGTVVQMIKEILDTRIRPTVQDDGGDVEFRGFDEKTGWVRLKLVGACRTCSSSAITLRNGIENMLMHYIPEVRGVEQVLDDEEQVAIKEFDKFEAELEHRRDQDDVKKKTE